MLKELPKSKNYKFIKKPWGGYLVLEKSPRYWIKKLFINEGEQLSLQSHKNRDEIWIVLQGKIQAQKGEAFFILEEGEYLKINKKEKHKLHALIYTIVLEVALGQPRERDIIRYQDKYGRVEEIKRVSTNFAA